MIEAAEAVEADAERAMAGQGQAQRYVLPSVT
jgi:hypothetical protein